MSRQKCLWISTQDFQNAGLLCIYSPYGWWTPCLSPDIIYVSSKITPAIWLDMLREGNYGNLWSSGNNCRYSIPTLPYSTPSFWAYCIACELEWNGITFLSLANISSYKELGYIMAENWLLYTLLLSRIKQKRVHNCSYPLIIDTSIEQHSYDVKIP